MWRHMRRGVGDAQPRQTPVFQSVPLGMSGQAAMPTTAGLTASHTSTYGVPVTRTWGWRDRRRQAGLLAAGDEVVDEHAQAVAGAGAEGVDDLGQVVDAVEALDDDALDAQVVAPHLLDQLGVVDALDQDAAGPGHPGPVRRRRRSSRRW